MCGHTYFNIYMFSTCRLTVTDTEKWQEEIRKDSEQLKTMVLLN